MDTRFKVVIGGKLLEAGSGQTMEVVNPANGTVVAEVPNCGAREVDAAVEAARQAAPGWAATSLAGRAKAMFKLAELVRAHQQELAELETRQQGAPIFKTTHVDAPGCADALEWAAGIGRGLAGLTLPVGPSARSMTVREPLGVVGLITPWNFPLMVVASKLGPALICGNTCVVKPPSCAPLTALRLAELAVESGLPAGVFNVVTGPGGTVGEDLVQHPHVAAINFTGGSATGRRILSLASAAVKPVAAELGGKNPFIVLADADLDAVVEMATFGAFFNSGQVCASPTRFLVHESVYDRFLERFVATARKLRVGDPFNPMTQMGPVAYREHRDSVERYIESARNSGARLLLGGERPNTPETKDGYFVMPTIFADCNNQMEFVRDEIFGPVSAVIPFATVEEAVEIANDTRYGLCASVWTGDVRRALVIADQIKAGTVWINQHMVMAFEVPWGGYKESGWSKENSTLVLDEYTATKHVWIDLAGAPGTPWHDLVS